MIVALLPCLSEPRTLQLSPKSIVVGVSLFLVRSTPDELETRLCDARALPGTSRCHSLADIGVLRVHPGISAMQSLDKDDAFAPEFLSSTGHVSVSGLLYGVSLSVISNEDHYFGALHSPSRVVCLWHPHLVELLPLSEEGFPHGLRPCFPSRLECVGTGIEIRQL